MVRTGSFRSRAGAIEPVFLPGQDVRTRIVRLSPGAKRYGPFPVSLLLHATLLALLLVSFKPAPPEMSLPLNGVSVVFEGTPQNNAVNAAPSRRPTTRPSPTKGQPESLPTPPAPAQPQPLPVAPEVNLAPIAPAPFQPPETPSPQFIVPPPQPRPAPRHAQPKQNYLVMNDMSFNAPPAPKVLNPGHQGLNLTPANDHATEQSDLVEIKGHVGSGWNNLLKRWAQEHVYYPDAAALRNQEGPVTVEIVIDRSGHVISEHLIKGSKSVFLNMAWSGLWRDAHVPPFPPNTVDKTITIDFTMHYILIPQ